MKRKLFIAITLSNYLIDRTGTPKVVMSHQEMANSAGAKYVALFPVGRSSKYMRALFNDSIGVICDGEFKGIYSISQLLSFVNDLLDNKYILECIYIHHLMGWNLDLIARLLKFYSSANVVVYAHDYYLCCTNYNLLNTEGQLCGASRLGDTQCLNCPYFDESRKKEECIWGILRNELCRTVYAFPSKVVLRMVESFHPEIKGNTEIVPHQQFIGEFHGNKSKLAYDHKIKVAYLGKQQSFKGWDSWCRLVEMYGDKYEFIVFNNEETPLPCGMRRVFVEFSANNPNAMIDALRFENVDVALLWSQCLETYSYTCMEAYSSNVFIVTSHLSGNVADFVSSTKSGTVLSSEIELQQLFNDSSRFLEVLNEFRCREDCGPLMLATNTAFLDLPRSHKTVSSFVYAEPHRFNRTCFQLTDYLYLPLRTLLTYREKQKVIAATSEKYERIK